MLLQRLRSAVRIEPTGSAVRRCGSPRIPGRSGLDRIARIGIAVELAGAVLHARMDRRTQPNAHIGGQSFEERSGISRLGFMSFLVRQ